MHVRQASVRKAKIFKIFHLSGSDNSIYHPCTSLFVLLIGVHPLLDIQLPEKWDKDDTHITKKKRQRWHAYKKVV